MIDLDRLVDGTPNKPAAPPKEGLPPSDPGADSRFRCCCWRDAVAEAILSDVRMRFSVVSK